jgi:hypothetical protein
VNTAENPEIPRTSSDKQKRLKYGLSEEIFLSNRQFTVHEVNMFRISFWSFHSILKENVNMDQTTAKVVPCLLSALHVHEFLAKNTTPSLHSKFSAV